MVRNIAGVVLATLCAASATAADWQRPDCSGFDSESACINDFRNDYRRQKQAELKEKGVSFWYYERPDFADDKSIEKALEKKLEGRVQIAFDITAEGKTRNVSVSSVTSESMHVYVPALLEAVKNWQFVAPQKALTGEQWDFTFLFASTDKGSEE